MHLGVDRHEFFCCHFQLSGLLPSPAQTGCKCVRAGDAWISVREGELLSQALHSWLALKWELATSSQSTPWAEQGFTHWVCMAYLSKPWIQLHYTQVMTRRGLKEKPSPGRKRGKPPVAHPYWWFFWAAWESCACRITEQSQEELGRGSVCAFVRNREMKWVLFVFLIFLLSLLLFSMLGIFLNFIIFTSLYLLRDFFFLVTD